MSTNSRSSQEELEEQLVRYQEEAYKKVEAKLDTLINLFQDHIKSEGHELLSRRVKAVEEQQDQHGQRPFKTWQIVAGIISILATICFLSMSFINTIISVILFVRTLHP